VKKGTNYKKEARKAEEIKKVNIEKHDEKSNKISTIESTLRNQDIYNAGTAKAEGNTLLGFQAPEDFVPREDRPRGGPRGGRGAFRGGRGTRGGA
jgi:hypothetical protein